MKVHFPPFPALLVIPGLIKLNLPESCTVQISTFADLHNSLFSLSDSSYSCVFVAHFFFFMHNLSGYLFEGCPYLCFVLDSDVELVMLILVFDTGCRGERLDKELKELLKESEDIRKISEISDGSTR